MWRRGIPRRPCVVEDLPNTLSSCASMIWACFSIPHFIVMSMMQWSRFALVAAAAIILLVGPTSVAGQTVPPPGTPPDEIRRQIEGAGLQGRLLEQMRRSGMSPDEIRRAGAPGLSVDAVGPVHG
jgi:hypothetical protein